MKSFKLKILALVPFCLAGCTGLADSTSIRRAYPQADPVETLKKRKRERLMYGKGPRWLERMENGDSFSIELAAWYGLPFADLLTEIVSKLPFHVSKRLAAAGLPLSNSIAMQWDIRASLEREAKAGINTPYMTKKRDREEKGKTLYSWSYQEKQRPLMIYSKCELLHQVNNIVSTNREDIFFVDRAKVFGKDVISIICPYIGVTKTYFLMKRISKDWNTAIQDLYPLEKELQRLRNDMFDKGLIEEILRNHCSDYKSICENFFFVFHPVELRQLFKQYPELFEICSNKAYAQGLLQSLLALN